MYHCLQKVFQIPRTQLSHGLTRSSEIWTTMARKKVITLLSLFHIKVLVKVPLLSQYGGELIGCDR